MQYKHIWLIGLTLTFGWMSPRMAKTVSFDSLDQLVSYGMTHNTQLAARHHEWESARQLPQEMGSLDAPMIGLRFNGLPAQKDGHIADQTRLILAQKLPFWGTLDHRQDIGTTKAKIAYWDLVMQQSKVTLSLKTLTYQLILTDQLIAIIDKNASNISQIITITDTKYRAGIGLQAHVLQAKIAEGKLTIERLSLAHQRRTLLVAIQTALSLDPEDVADINIAYPKKIKERPLPSQIQIKNSLISQKQDAIVDNTKATLQVKQDAYLPQFSAQVEYWNNSMMDNQYGGQVMMSVPWGNPKNEASIIAATQKRYAEEKRQQDLLNNETYLVSTLISELTTTVQKIQIYDSVLLRDASLAFQNVQHAFAVNKASFTDYFEAEKTLFQLEKEHALLQNQYHTRLAELESRFQYE